MKGDTQVFNVDVTKVNADGVLWRLVSQCSLCGATHVTTHPNDDRAQRADYWMQDHYETCPEAQA